MKRAFFEWCGLISLVLSVVCLFYWGVSVVSEVADFDLSFGERRTVMQMLVTNGKITLCDHIGNLELIELVKNSRPFEPAPSEVYGWSIPGFHFSFITFNGSSPVWSLNLSLLIPFAIMLVLGGFCFHRYRLFRRAVAAPSASVT